MNVDTMQELIDKTDYWDMRILDVKASYFGDEVELLIDNNEETYWKISFLSCYKVSYKTDADRRKISDVKSMKKVNLGFTHRILPFVKVTNRIFIKLIWIFLLCK